MNVLIVDDQPEVVESMVTGFPAWCVFSFLRTRNLNMRRRL